LLRQLTVTKTQLRDLRISNDSNQEKLLDHTQKQGKILIPFLVDSNQFFLDDAVAAKLAEVDMIVADLDRANSRVVALEHRNVRLHSLANHLTSNDFRKFCVQRLRPCAVVLRVRSGMP
jgi:homeobox protein cut-like